MATYKWLSNQLTVKKLISGASFRFCNHQIILPVFKGARHFSKFVQSKSPIQNLFKSSISTTSSLPYSWERYITTSSLLAADYEVVHTPPFAESITEGDVRWEKGVGDSVTEDEVVGEIETDKTSIPITASAAGVIVELFVEDGEKVEKGDKLFKIEIGASDGGQAGAAKAEESESIPELAMTEAQSPEPVQQAASSAPPQAAEAEKPSGPIKMTKPTPPPPPPASQLPVHSVKQTSAKVAPEKLGGSRQETRVKMSRMRLRIAQRLKDAQNVNAMLTTFNEVDMSNIMDLRSKHKDAFLKNHGLKLGFMSAFTKAASYALQSMPVVNAVIEDDHIVYRDYVDISVAVATPKGLVVPVLRDVQNMNYLDIERGIAELGEKARKGELAIEDMDGGTFTISNGGVFGSLLGTPIINPPQSAILGLHAINDRPVALNGQVVIRPIMYLALTYDHRLVDGREAVTFLRKIKSAVEDPRIMFLNL